MERHEPRCIGLLTSRQEYVFNVSGDFCRPTSPKTRFVSPPGAHWRHFGNLDARWRADGMPFVGTMDPQSTRNHAIRGIWWTNTMIMMFFGQSRQTTNGDYFPPTDLPLSPELPWPSPTSLARMPERVIDELQRMPPGASAPTHQYYRATLVQSDLIGFTSSLVQKRLRRKWVKWWAEFGTCLGKVTASSYIYIYIFFSPDNIQFCTFLRKVFPSVCCFLFAWCLLLLCLPDCYCFSTQHHLTVLRSVVDRPCISTSIPNDCYQVYGYSIRFN